MRTRAGWKVLAIAAVAALLATGCSGGDDASSRPNSSASTTTTEPKLIDRISSAGCATDRDTLQTAIEAYRATATDPTVVPTEADLVAKQFLREESEYYDIEDTGTSYALVAAPGGGCER